MHVPRLAAAARAEQRLGARGLQPCDEIRIRDDEIGREHQLVAGKVRMLADDIDVHAEAGDSRIPGSSATAEAE